ncbi:hypothetical protein NSMS1_20810 [Nostoc sp. MS1]|nr:hypothetical protein NSMS1_20810 [Nostoc sp. MS1]
MKANKLPLSDKLSPNTYSLEKLAAEAFRGNIKEKEIKVAANILIFMFDE